MNNMSQEELAFGICSVSTLSRIENGIENPSKATLDKMLNKLADENKFLYGDISEIEAFRLRYQIARNIIKNQRGKNTSLLLQYYEQERDDVFLKYIEAIKYYDEHEFAKCELLLKELFKWNGIDEDKSRLEYAILEPYVLQAFLLFVNCLRKKGEYKKAEWVLEALKKYMEENNNYDGIYGDLYISILTEYADLMVEIGDISEGLALCALSLDEMQCREKSYLKKRVFNIKARAYGLKGKQDLEKENVKYALILSELGKSHLVERENVKAIPIFNC